MDQSQFSGGDECIVACGSDLKEWYVKIANITLINAFTNKYHIFIDRTYYILAFSLGRVVKHPRTVTMQLAVHQYGRDTVQFTSQLKRKCLLYPEPAFKRQSILVPSHWLDMPSSKSSKKWLTETWSNGLYAHPLKRILFLENSFLVLLCNLLFLLFQRDHSPAATHEMSAVVTLSSGSISWLPSMPAFQQLFVVGPGFSPIQAKVVLLKRVQNWFHVETYQITEKQILTSPS